MPPPISFDYSKGSAFIYDSTLYYSPNCPHPIVIPPRSISSLFNGSRLDATQFCQPVWWTSSWGWLSFIPLSPSFISFPFEILCWMPRIIECNELHRSGTYVKRFVMSAEDADKWMKAEETLVNAVDSIRLAFSIAGNPPPLLLSFGFTRSHKTYGIAKRIITVSCDWFAIWMGFIAYLIAMTEGKNQGVIKGSPLPSWYQHLLTHNFQDPWLNGMMLSNVCSFDAQTPRAGVIFQWIQEDPSRPTIEWFYRHHIPIWFIWSCVGLGMTLTLRIIRSSLLCT